jgi:hypothetical protein
MMNDVRACGRCFLWKWSGTVINSSELTKSEYRREGIGARFRSAQA